MEEEGLSEARKVVMAASLADISIRVCSFSQTCYLRAFLGKDVLSPLWSCG